MTTAPTLDEFGALKSALERLELISRRGDDSRRLDQGEARVLLEHARRREISTKRLNMEGPIATVQYELHSPNGRATFNTLKEAQDEAREAKKRGFVYRIVRVTTTKELL